MAHYFESGFFGSAKPAWHGLGVVVAGCPNSADALELAGLGWAVTLEPVYVSDGNGGRVEIEKWRATVRSDKPAGDPARALGCVGARYEPIQNVEAFAMADELVGEGGARYESAGSLKGGRRVWLLAKLPASTDVQGDQLAQYLLLTNAHDGTRAMECLLTPVRVVCWNTLSLALRRGAQHRVKLRHTRNVRDKIGEARRVLGLAGEYFQEHAQTMGELAQYRVDDAFRDAYLKALIPDPNGDASPTRARKARVQVGSLFHGSQFGQAEPALRGNAYGLLNAVSAFVDHYRTVRTTKGSTRAENRMESILYGSGSQLRDKAFGLLSRATGIGSDEIPLVAAANPNPTADDVLSMVNVG